MIDLSQKRLLSEENLDIKENIRIKPFYYLGEENLDIRENIRIKPFYYLDWASERVSSNIKDQIIPAVISYFEAALKVNRLLKNIRLSQDSISSCCHISDPPRILSKEGVPADLVVFITGKSFAVQEILAMASVCVYPSETTRRPNTGVIQYNINKNWDTSGDEVTNEVHLLIIMHEFMHILGFHIYYFDYFMDPASGKTLSNHVRKITLNGIETKMISLEPLTKRLRKYFNCPTLEDAYLENQGGAESKDSHFERRVFYNELMTPTVTKDDRISEFSLAFLEGTGWYTPNYDMAEPMFWGKGKGCGFVSGTWINSSYFIGNNTYIYLPIFSFQQYCDHDGENGCTFSGQWKGRCGNSDSYMDNCFSYIPRIACYNPKNQNNSIIRGETFGPDSMCFRGTLSEKGKMSSYGQYCIKQSCEEFSNGNFSLQLEIDGAIYHCSDRKSLQVNGYGGFLHCPDNIDEFCSTKALKYCKRGCMGRGTCKNGACICDEGYGGQDCSRKIEPLPEPLPEVENHEDSELLDYNDHSAEIFWLLLVSVLIAGLLICLGKLYKKNKSQAPKQSTYQPPNLDVLPSLDSMAKNNEKKSSESKTALELTFFEAQPQQNGEFSLIEDGSIAHLGLKNVQ